MSWINELKKLLSVLEDENYPDPRFNEEYG